MYSIDWGDGCTAWSLMYGCEYCPGSLDGLSNSFTCKALSLIILDNLSEHPQGFATKFTMCSSKTSRHYVINIDFCSISWFDLVLYSWYNYS